MTIRIRDQNCYLLPERALYLPGPGILVIADIHLGKLTHFRRQGIMAPARHINEDLGLVGQLIERWQPTELVFLGDLFHSEINSEYAALAELIDTFPGVDFTLTMGNHDIIPEQYFIDAGIRVCTELVLPGQLVLRHELPVEPDPAAFYITGHIHPGYLLSGKARQNFRLPCFCLGRQGLVVPAFGRHTGLYIPAYTQDEQLFLVMGDEVIALKGR